MSKPNPLPWRADGPDIFDATNEWVAVGAFNGDLAAREIVQAVNAHAALLAACEDMLPLLEHAENVEASADDGIGDRLRSLRRRLVSARAALALAKPEGK